MANKVKLAESMGFSIAAIVLATSVLGAVNQAPLHNGRRCKSSYFERPEIFANGCTS